MRESLHLSAYVDRSAADVYAYAVDPAHLPLWAAGLSAGIERREGRWVSRSPMGEVEVRFAPQNPYGVLDHEVTLPDGTAVANPMRVIPDGERCEVVFTLRRRADTTDEAFAADAVAVRTDLASLKAILEH